MSTPLGEKTFATTPVPLDDLAARLDPGHEGLEAANDIVPHAICRPRHQNVWSSSGALCSLLSGHEDGAAPR